MEGGRVAASRKGVQDDDDVELGALEPVGGVVRITVVAVSGSRPAEDGALAAALESARTDQWSPQMNA